MGGCNRKALRVEKKIKEMENNDQSSLNASYVFYSATTQTHYILNVTTGPLTYPIKALDNPNCKGYTIINGTLTVVTNSGSTPYNVPGGNTGFIYNGLWTSAADSPDEEGSPWCNGIDRLIVVFNQKTSNTMINANDSSSITIVNSSTNDTATLVHSVFPPTA